MKRLTRLSLIGAAALAPLAAMAAIDGSHHDMTAAGVNIGTTEKCAYCHSISGVTLSSGYGTVGNFCVSICHQGAGAVFGSNDQVLPTAPQIATGDVTAGWTYLTGGTANPTIFTTSHGYAKISIPLPDAEGDVTTTAWPHVSEGEIQCTSCHTVHDNQNAPFLNGPLATGTAATAFCARCHTGSAKTADNAGRYGVGTHPTEVTWRNENTSTRTLWASPSATNHVVENTGGDNLQTDGNSWNTGGHIIDLALSNGSALGTTGMPISAAEAVASATAVIGCYSCHSAHTDNNVQSTAVATALTLTSSLQNICYACHGGGLDTVTDPTTTQENPGATKYYHPVNKEAPVSALNISVALSAGYTAIPTPLARPAVNVTTPNSPWCVSCHDVHGGKGTGMALRDVNGTGLVVDFCAECHTGQIANHHISGTATNYTVAANGLYAADTPWTGAGNNNLTDGLQCSDCHGVSDSAHNW